MSTRLYHVSAEISETLRRLGIYMDAGVNVMLHADTVYEPPLALPHGLDTGGPFAMGAFSYSFTRLSRQVEQVGRYCSFAGATNFGAAEHPTDRLSTSSFTYDPHFPIFKDFAASNGSFEVRNVPMEQRHRGIVVENDVWIGSFAYIRGGVRLGTGCIVGTGAVVTKDVPPYAIVAGNPARVRRYRFDDKTIERLLASKWWRYKFTDFSTLNVTNVGGFLDRLKQADLDVYAPATIRVSELLMPI